MTGFSASFVLLKEKEEVKPINEALNSELEDLTEKPSTSTSDIYDLKEEIAALVSCFYPLT
jgi:predicted  nucleic acid-binding Zn-ribbon protein